jgi:hypothetical protein
MSTNPCPACGACVRVSRDAEADCPRCGAPLPRRERPPLSAPMVPNDDVHGIRKPRSIIRESLRFFAVLVPAVLVAMAVVLWIISLVESARK